MIAITRIMIPEISNIVIADTRMIVGRTKRRLPTPTIASALLKTKIFHTSMAIKAEITTLGTKDMIDTIYNFLKITVFIFIEPKNKNASKLIAASFNRQIKLKQVVNNSTHENMIINFLVFPAQIQSILH